MSQTKPRYISPATIEALSERIRKDAGLNVNEPGAVDVVKLAQTLGCQVQTVVFDPSTISAKIERTNDDTCIIQISSTDGAERQRFSIAHELSHYILHDEGEFIEYRKPLAEYDNPDLLYKEIQANMLASAILMSRELVKRAWDNSKDIDDLADIFNVSKSAVYYRLDNLNLLNG